MQGDPKQDGPAPGALSSPGAGMCLADAHADSLMWNRPLEREGLGGHVDFPRLRRAGVGLQCFTVVTGGFPYVGGFSLFGAWRRWPREALATPWSRYRFQVEALRRACAASEDRVRLTTSRGALDDNLADGRLSAILGVEGGQVIGRDVSRVATLARDGVRFMSLTHLANNALAGASFPAPRRPGLSRLGGAVVEAMGAHRIAVDVAHASPATLEGLLASPAARLMCSHTGVSGVTPHFRNLGDPVLRAIAERGGVVGIILARVYLGGRGIDAVVRHIEHAMKVMGEEGVGLGSDHDGMVALPDGMRDVEDLPRIAEALRARGHPTARVEKVMGGNWIRYFRELLP